MKKGFGIEPLYNEKYLKTGKKSYEGKISTKMHSGNIPKEGSQYICLSVILIDSVYRSGKHYYPQLLLEEGKSVVKVKNISKHTTDGIEIFYNDSDEENSDKENSEAEN